MATDPQSLITAAECYECFLPQAWLLKLGLLQQILLAQNPMADTSPQGLITAAECYDCPPLYALYELGLLKQIAAGGGGGGGGTGGPGIIGTGSPEGAVTAPPGTSYLDSSGDHYWIKKTGTGNTGWVELIA